MDGLARLQSRVENRYYVTALAFAHELGDAINAGINTVPQVLEVIDPTEAMDVSPAKHPFADIRERRKLGRRILKAVQPFLETALRVESEISQKPYEGLQKELEAIIDASVDGQTRQDQQDGDDTIMVDAPDTSVISVKSTAAENLANGDSMDTLEDAEGEEEEGDSIEVNTSGLGIVNGDAGEEFKMTNRRSTRGGLTNGVSSETPPDSNGYVTIAPPVQTGPPTPPQSNGSLGKEPLDPLAEGGVLWYLKAYQPRGTSILGEHWAGRDAVRMLSEDLTDLDDEELKGLGADVDDTVTGMAGLLDVDETSETLAPGSAKKASRVKKRRASGRRR